MKKLLLATCVCLAACGGGSDDGPDQPESPQAPVDYCPDSSPTSLSGACTVEINPPADAVIDVDITAELVVVNDGDAPADFARFVYISFAGDMYEPTDLAGVAPPGTSTYPIHLTRRFDGVPTTTRPILVGLSAWTVFGKLAGEVRNIQVDVTVR